MLFKLDLPNYPVPQAVAKDTNGVIFVLICL